MSDSPVRSSEAEDQTSSSALSVDSPKDRTKGDIVKRLREHFGDSSDSASETKFKRKKLVKKTLRKTSRQAGEEPEFQGLDHTGSRAFVSRPSTSGAEAQSFEVFPI